MRYLDLAAADSSGSDDEDDEDPDLACTLSTISLHTVSSTNAIAFFNGSESTEGQSGPSTYRLHSPSESSEVPEDLERVAQSIKDRYAQASSSLSKPDERIFQVFVQVCPSFFNKICCKLNLL